MLFRSVLHLGLNNPKCDYMLNNETLPKVVNAIRDLGIFIMPNLKWDIHINKKCILANVKFFNIIKAFKSKDHTFFVRLYVTYVRPILEFSSSVFNTNLVKNIAKIESVQRRITKIIFRRCFNKLYPIPPSYEERLFILGLHKLRIRFIINYLVLLHKFKLGIIPSYPTSSVNIQALKFKRNRNSLYIPTTRTSVRNNSFFIRTTKVYLKLNLDIINTNSIISFRKKLENIDLSLLI